MIDTKRWLEFSLAQWLASAGTPCGVGLAFTLTSLVFSNTAEATVLHVPGDFPTIQACVDAAQTGDECVVAPGTYNELIDFGGKAVTLRSSDGPEVTIIDAGPVPDPGTGKPVVRCDTSEGSDTVLEGFTLTGGTGSVCGASGTSTCGGGMYNVASSPTVNNCTIIANSAVGGGGIFNDGASPTVDHCTLGGNTALGGLGGGMGNRQNSNPTVSDCVFSSNVGGGGGGMGNAENSNPIVTHCAFSGNSGGRGGGMYNVFDSGPTVTHCTFNENTGVLAGGMWNAASSNPIVSDCTFAENGGGGMVNSGSSPTLTNCTFADNSGTGGLSNVSNSSPTVTNCAFTRNATDGSGGGMANSFESNPTVTNCTFVANTAHGTFEAGGGGMSNFGSSPTVTNCTFGGNIASLGDGGGMYSPFGSATVTNCVFWGNRPNQIANEPDGATTVGYSNVQAGWPGIANIDSDPLFADPIGPDGIPGTGDEDVRLLPGSPCIDVGNKAAVPADTTDLDEDGDTTEPIPLDLDGNARFVDDPATPDCPLGGCGTAPLADMGAYEVQQPCQTNADCDDGRPCTADVCNAGRCVITPMQDCIRWYVDDDHCPAAGTGTPADPLCSIQAGINMAVRGDTVLVAPGTYNELINFHGKAVTLRSSCGSDVTVIDAEQLPIDPSGKTVVRCETGEGPETVLDGFTLTGGTGTVDLGGSRRGGGMFNHGASPTVANCTFRGNSAFGNFGTGGGMYNEFGSSPTVIHCAFTENESVFGGGMYSRVNSHPTVSDSTFAKNMAVDTGGGMRNFDSANPTVINCTFRGNSADTGGGMANRENSNPTVTNCAFVGNTANFGGGMENVDGSGPTATGCTFSGNSAATGGGMLTTNEFGAPSAATLNNCIVWGNAPDQIADDFGAVTTVGYSDVQGTWPGVGNIDADPMFVRNPSDGGDGWGDDPGTPDVDEGVNDDFGDLRLLFGSPCRDAGNNAALPPDTLDLDGDGDTLEPTPFDLDGHARILCAVVDMGAYESGIGDDDCDGHVDLTDYAAYFDCLTGPAGGLPMGCQPFDFDGDGNIDLTDVAGVQRAFTGSP